MDVIFLWHGIALSFLQQYTVHYPVPWFNIPHLVQVYAKVLVYSYYLRNIALAVDGIAAIVKPQQQKANHTKWVNAFRAWAKIRTQMNDVSNMHTVQNLKPNNLNLKTRNP